MNNQQASMWERQSSGIGKASPVAWGQTRARGRGLPWSTRVRTVLRPSVLSGASLLLLIGIIKVPLPANAASLGTGWSEHIYTGAAGSTTAWGQYANARIGFSGTLNPSLGRASVTIVVQKVGSTTTTVGTLTTLTRRVFNTQPASLPSLFATMGVTAQPNTTYRIAVDAGSQTLTSTTITLAR
ncbi:MAG TPA: hypothetical protein VNL35_09500 [Chloroflexota bacterium]|nr:hypothetical protein [Chloroflexota bacterium]